MRRTGLRTRGNEQQEQHRQPRGTTASTCGRKQHWDNELRDKTRQEQYSPPAPVAVAAPPAASEITTKEPCVTLD